MPMMMINGQWTETPVGYNPLTDPNNSAYQAPGVVQAANQGAAGAAAWQSQNKPAAAGNPWGYQYDPRFQAGTGKDINDPYTDWLRQSQGMQTLASTPPVIGGLAGQQNLTNTGRALGADGGIPAPPATPGATNQVPQAVTRDTPGGSANTAAPAQVGVPPVAAQPPQQPQGGGYGGPPVSSPPQFSPPQQAQQPAQQPPQQAQAPQIYNPYQQQPQQQPWWMQPQQQQYNPFANMGFQQPALGGYQGGAFGQPYNPFQGFGGGFQQPFSPFQGFGQQQSFGMTAPQGGFGGLGGMAVGQNGMAQGVGPQQQSFQQPFQAQQQQPSYAPPVGYGGFGGGQLGNQMGMGQQQYGGMNQVLRQFGGGGGYGQPQISGMGMQGGGQQQQLQQLIMALRQMGMF